jgi:hypothetical protein
MGQVIVPGFRVDRCDARQGDWGIREKGVAMKPSTVAEPPSKRVTSD